MITSTEGHRLNAPDSPLTLAAVEVFRHDCVPLALTPREKRPARSDWQHVTYRDEAAVVREFAAMLDGAGLGVRLGAGLADVDLDSPTARRAAPLLLPETAMRSGRPSAPGSHWWYQLSDGGECYVKHTGADGSTVVELRATQGHQTVLPPSLHPSGELYAWEGEPWGAAEVTTAEVQAATAAVALVAVLADAWPEEGSRHDAYLALAGALLREGEAVPAVVRWTERVVAALAVLTADRDGTGARVAEAVPSTAKKLAAGENVTGWTTLAKHLLADPAAVVKAAQRAADHLRVALGVAPPSIASLAPAADPADFWEARPFLRCARDYARARRVGPWALLGAVLARTSASVPPSVVLPPTRGAVASLNLFVALCSESGGGKTTAMEAAGDFLAVTGGTADYLDTQPGSGEGLLSAYCYVKLEKGQAPQVVQTRLSVLFDVDEVQSLGALTGRTNSTLLPFLKSAWSGKTLATQNAEASRLRRVGAHAYRLAVVAGVQPVNAGVILDDEGGGFPQRWLWMPTYDPGMLPRDARPAEPLPWSWQVPGAALTVAADDTITWPLRRVVALPEVAVSAMLDAAESQNRPIGRGAGDPLLAHALLTRAKVAALLALLDGRDDEVAGDDWRLAGHVMAVSERTRGEVVGARGEVVRRAEDRKAERSGRSAVIAADSEAEIRTVRAMEVISAALKRHPGEHSTNAVQKLAGRYRVVVPDALARMVESGELAAEERTGGNGKRAVFYRLAAAS